MAHSNDMLMIPAWKDDVLTPMDKFEVHLQGLRHKAVSVFLLDASGRILIQRRALEKYHTPGLWANTCCTHPLWGETGLDCAYRRLEQELGITGVDLKARGQLHYRAEVGGGMIEDEEVEVFIGQTDLNLAVTPNPEEVMDWRWDSLAELRSEISTNPERFTPWMRIYMDQHSQQILGH